MSTRYCQADSICAAAYVFRIQWLVEFIDQYIFTKLIRNQFDISMHLQFSTSSLIYITWDTSKICVHFRNIKMFNFFFRIPDLFFIFLLPCYLSHILIYTPYIISFVCDWGKSHNRSWNAEILTYISLSVWPFHFFQFGFKNVHHTNNANVNTCMRDMPITLSCPVILISNK